MNNKRIEAISQLINNDESVVDIGCDHGYLAEILRKRGNDQLIVCSDNKSGPLNNAKNNLCNYENIRFVLSDGVKNVKEQCDVAVMAGMGHNTVISIMNDNPQYFHSCKKIIIQVNQIVSQMRRYLMENGYKISDEKMILDYKYYQIMLVTNEKESLTDFQIEFGPKLLERKEEIFVQCYQKQLLHLQSLMEQLPQDHPDRKQLSEKIEQIKSVL
ncbi:MAG: tRNA (adenine(22)-N(1))-methyltransferase [Erysipelotrichaceae bacterium]